MKKYALILALAFIGITPGLSATHCICPENTACSQQECVAKCPCDAAAKPQEARDEVKIGTACMTQEACLQAHKDTPQHQQCCTMERNKADRH